MIRMMLREERDVRDQSEFEFTLSGWISKMTKMGAILMILCASGCPNPWGFIAEHRRPSLVLYFCMYYGLLSNLHMPPELYILIGCNMVLLL